MGKVEVGRSRGLFGLDHVSTGSEEDEVCPDKALSVLDPSASAWIYLLSSQPSCLVHNPVLRMPRPRWGQQGLANLLLGSSSLRKEGGSEQGLWASRPWGRGSSLVASGSNRAGLCPRSPSRGGRTASASPSAVTLRFESRLWILVSVSADASPA